ncbi:hypothetical protein [Lysinibacillus sp. 3P01SB]|uniref:hypothetical protein n=1 Tax=Lysinibacillus sp. 3P01SB TaxID=3132284 RepID=UPI0039A647E6
MTQLQVFRNAFIALLVIFVLSFTYMFSQVDVITTKEITEEQIVEEDGQHYIVLEFESRKLKISEDLLQSIELDKYKEYNISYSYNKLFSKTGKINSIIPYGKTP